MPRAGAGSGSPGGARAEEEVLVVAMRPSFPAQYTYILPYSVYRRKRSCTGYTKYLGFHSAPVEVR